MKYAILQLQSYGYYRCLSFSDEETALMGDFLAELGCPGTSLDEWVLDDEQDLTSGNSMVLEKEDSYIYISDYYDQNAEPEKLRIAVKSFMQILSDWKEKVCKVMPKEVTIIRNGDDFTLETKD
jgi:hypothetical protein